MDFLHEDFTNSTERLDRPSQYLIKKAIRRQTFADLEQSLHLKTVYVGELSHFTTEEQIHELFLKCGTIDRIIMGLDRNKLTPCGFCFVVYKTEDGLLSAMKFLKGTILDGQSLTIDLDPGFREGRQFGRGALGGQVSQESSSFITRGRGRGRSRGRGVHGSRGGNRGSRGVFNGRFNEGIHGVHNDR